MQLVQFSRLALSALFTAAAVLGLTGCGDRPPRPDARAEQMSAEPAQPAKSGEETFFDGKIVVEASLGRSFGARGPGGRMKGRGQMPGGSGRPGGPGGGGPGRGGESYTGGSESPVLRISESAFPAITLQLRLTNNSAETVEVQFVLCQSELGDFAVRPEKLALAPGQSAEPDAMTSRLGLTSSELQLTVASHPLHALLLIALQSGRPGATRAFPTPATPRLQRQENRVATFSTEIDGFVTNQAYSELSIGDAIPHRSQPQGLL